MKKIPNTEYIDKTLFNELQAMAEQRGVSGDKSDFKTIKANLDNPKIVSADEFAEELTYVVLTAGFRQQTARKIFDKIMEARRAGNFNREALMSIFNNKLKNDAILKIWENRAEYRDLFYQQNTDEDKIKYLKSMPYVGDITKYHIARNLGLNVVKYDIWIQKLGLCLEDNCLTLEAVNNQKLPPEVRTLCDTMFRKLETQLLEKRGFIDVVLWRSCEQGILQIKNKEVFLCD